MLLWSVSTVAGPSIAAGELALRHDIQRLADAGVIKGPISTWPLAWGPIASDIRAVGDELELSADVLQSLRRVRARAAWEMRTHEIRLRAHASVAENPTRIRAFQDTPRESAEFGGGIAWTGDWLSIGLNGQVLNYLFCRP